MYFCYFLIIFLSPHDALCQVWLNWPSGSGGVDFKISLMYFRNFLIISIWKMAWPFICRNLNPHHPRMHCIMLVEIGPVVLEKKIFIFRQCIFTISLFVRCGPSFTQTYIPFTLGCFVLSLFEIGSLFFKKKMKM